MTRTTAEEAILRCDLRRQRAQVLVAHIMHLIDPYLADERERDVRRHAYRALYDAFWPAGVEVITDYDRAAAGLPPRNGEGWTAQELVALELQRLEAMTRPFTVPELLP